MLLLSKYMPYGNNTSIVVLQLFLNYVILWVL